MERDCGRQVQHLDNRKSSRSRSSSSRARRGRKMFVAKSLRRGRAAVRSTRAPLLLLRQVSSAPAWDDLPVRLSVCHARAASNALANADFILRSLPACLPACLLLPSRLSDAFSPPFLFFVFFFLLAPPARLISLNARILSSALRRILLSWF